jgi:protein-tyrosine phosphatase
MTRREPLAVLMVCLGNICRSPTAEAVLRAKLRAAGLHEQVSVDSAGTGSWHIGSSPDARSQRHALQRGYDLSDLRGRQVGEADFHRFDLMLAMDDANLADLLALAPPGRYRAEVRLFAPEPVPDPYVGGAAGFERVLDLVETACDAWIRDLARHVGTS